jgi:hypothetical protein
MRWSSIALVLVACTPHVATVPSATCATPANHQLDFWIGDWDIVVHARAKADAPLVDAKGRQHVEAVLGGCAIAETFAADGPGPAWAGRSYSSWQPQLAKWRQTWVDDSGGYIALTGGIENGVMTLYGEPSASFQMRMVYERVTPTSLHWEWQRSSDAWATTITMMAIDYTRR